VKEHRIVVNEIPITISGSFLRIAGVKPEEEHFFDISSPETIISHLRQERTTVDLFTFWQRLPETRPKFPYYFEWDNIAAVPIRNYEKWLKEQIHPNTRNKVKKSLKNGIEVKIVPFDDSLVQGIVAIFNECRIRQGRPFDHFGKSFETVKREWSSDSERSVFLAAYLQSELVGFIKLLNAGRYARTSGTICKLAHRDKAPMNALIAKAVEICANGNLEYLVYGKFCYGKKGMDSLTEFKKHNGFERVELPRFYVPLSAKGKLALSLGLHKGIIEVFPQKMVKFIVGVRSYWYQNRYSRLVGQAR
jgi:hypothetical protein